MTLPSPFLRLSSSKRARRAFVVVLATLLLHLFAAGWGGRQIGWWTPAPQPAVITVTLQTPPVPPPEPPIIRARQKRPPRPMQALTRPPRSASAPAAPATIVADNQSDWKTGPPAVGTDGGDGAAAMLAPAPPVSAASPAPPAPAQHAPNAPPSVALKYDVQGLREGNKVYGSGKIVWRNQDGLYRIEGNASVLFFTLLQFSSDGMLDDFGVSPALYTEQRFHKTATDTRFDHARNTITFSASHNSYPRPGDAQDRASIIWQLASIGRGNPAAFFDGAVFEFFVAGVHDAEPWRITVVGQENAGAGSDAMPSWHLVRLPQPGSYDQKIDIWLAPQQQWYPVRIRYTESNGEYLDMSLSSQTPL